MAELTPDEIRSATFTTSFRGLDPEGVRRYLESVATKVEELTAERDRLAARIRELGDRDLAAEFAAVSRDVGEVLETARQAAESMRERAAADAARWRSEAMAETEDERRRARADAEQLRGDAWSTAEELLTQAQREAHRLVEEAKEDALRRVGEAEREAHRIQATARREADDLVRNARMEAERLTAEAASRHDEIIQSAQREAEAAQERTRALEQRRDELKRELDSVRSALATLEGELDERREQLGLSVQAQPRPEEDEADEDDLSWTPGETVRVVRPHTPGPGETRDARKDVVGDEDPEDLGPDIRIIPASQLKAEPSEEPEPEEPAEEDEIDRVAELGLEETEADEGPVPSQESAPDEAPEAAEEAEEPPPLEEPDEPSPQRPPAEEPDDGSVAGEPPEDATGGGFEELEGLFARLRRPGEPPADDEVEFQAEPGLDSRAEAGSEAASSPESSPEPDEEAELAATPRAAASGGNEAAFERRERLLLPITNRALRSLKRQLTEEQNVVLDQLRLDEEGWEPEAGSVRDRVRADLVVLVSESFGAGHAAAEELLGDRIPRPSTPREEVADGFAAALTDELQRVLEEGRSQGQGGRQLSHGVSRVFRAWRTDEAERRVRSLASHAYHQGLADSLESSPAELRWVVSGRGCASCRAAAETPPGEVLPPLHPDCGCTITIT